MGRLGTRSTALEGSSTMRLGLVLGGAAALALVAGVSARAEATYGSTAVSTYTYALTSGPKSSAAISASADNDSSDTLLPDGINTGARLTSTTIYRGVTQATAIDAQQAGIVLSSASTGMAFLDGTSTAEVTASSTPASYAAAGQTTSTASYLFSVDTASTLNLSWLLSETNVPSLSTSYALIFDPAGADDVVGGDILAQNSSGAAGFALMAGSYELDFRTSTGGDPDVQQQGVGSASGHHSEQFSFNITSAAPEPSAWALMIAGVAVAGGALRTRRRAVAAA